MPPPTSKTAVLTALALSTAASGYEHKKDRAGEPVRWRAPVVLVVDQTVEQRLAPGAAGAVEAAARALAAELSDTALSTRPGAGGQLGFDFARGAVNQNQVLALDDWKGNPEAVAMTVLTVDHQQHAIVDADVAFDAAKTRWELSDPGRPGVERYDVQNTMTHELGHLAGLAHTQHPEAVMFPSTYPAETQKRRFADDDRAGLQSLYGAPTAGPAPAGEAPAQGCSSTGGSGAALPALALFALLRRQRAALALVAALAGLAAEGSEPSARGSLALVGRVTSVKTLPPAEGVTVLQTELWVQVAECVRGACPTTLRVLVPGGSWGNFSQTVGGLEIPEVGALVGLSRDEGAGAWVALEPLAGASAREQFVAQQAKARTVTAAALARPE